MAAVYEPGGRVGIVHKASGEGIVLAPLQAGDAGEARALILAGLAEHWGTLDPTMNSDLDDIAVSYAGTLFLVARLDGRIVGTGALAPLGDRVGQIMRMSVAAPLRRQGLGRKIVAVLVEQGRALGYERIVLETTATWGEVVAFYLDCGFRIAYYQGGDVYLTLDLCPLCRPVGCVYNPLQDRDG